MVTVRVPFRAAMRAAAVSLLSDYVDDANLDARVQIYRTIPTTIVPPTAFVERVSENQTFSGPTQRQRFAVARVVVLWRLFSDGERGDAVDQLDAFLDGFTDWVLEHYHEPGNTEIISSARIDDDPYFVLNDPTKGVRTYYAGRVDLEGYTGN